MSQGYSFQAVITWNTIGTPKAKEYARKAIEWAENSGQFSKKPILFY